MTATTIQHLPEEIILRIVQHLDTKPVSFTQQHQVPSAVLFTPSRSECGLKSFSRVCKDWRRIAFPVLYKHVKISADFLISRVLNPAEDPRSASRISNYNPEALSLKFDEYRLQRHGCFFQWAHSNDLKSMTESVLLYVTEISPSCMVEETEGLDARWISEPRRPMTIREINRKQLYHWLHSRLLALFRPRDYVLVAPPAAVANMLGTEVHLTDLWAFNMPFQRLHLHTGNSGTIAEASRPVHGRLLEYAEWTKIDYHAGSCLNLYGTCKTPLSIFSL